jgi:hypothetical protein
MVSVGFLTTDGSGQELTARVGICRIGDPQDIIVDRIGRELGSLAAALGGLDALVFTAGINIMG